VPTTDQDPGGRKGELAANLESVRRRIGAACAAAGRDATEVAMIAVTKTFPASDIRLLAELGVADIGENRDQEAATKAAACVDLPLTWHFVGQLQTNKARSVAGYADVVHSVDRRRLVALDDDPARGGARLADVPALAASIADADGLELGGVMAVAPLGADPAPAFAVLADIAAAVRAAHPAATMISAGMSGDLEQAIACGATHVRVGTALLGGRRAIVR
jgi:PLP dependent protein